MEASRRDVAPLWLFGIAAVALSLSLIAMRFWAARPRVDNPAFCLDASKERALSRWRLHENGVLDRRSGRHDVALQNRSVVREYRLACLERWLLNGARYPHRSDYVRRESFSMLTGPSHGPREEGRAELAFVLPGRPLWSADSRKVGKPRSRSPQACPRMVRGKEERLAVSPWSLFGYDATAMYEIGRVMGTLRPKGRGWFLHRSIGNDPSLEDSAKASGASRSAMGPLLTSPTDRLAMANDWSREASRRKIRSREKPLAESIFSPREDLDRRRVIQNPIALRQQLEHLAARPETEVWARSVRTALDSVTHPPFASTESESDEAIERLNQLADQAAKLAEGFDDQSSATLLRRAGYGVARRVDTWCAGRNIQRQKEARRLVAPKDVDQRLRERLGTFLDATQEEERGYAWREYLKAEQLSRCVDDAVRMPLAERRSLAKEILARMCDERLTREQALFMASRPIAALGDELRGWAIEPVDISGLMTRIERYESWPTPHLARGIAQDHQRLHESSSRTDRQFVRRLEENYRNANLRLAISKDLLVRYLPVQRPRTEPVRRRVVGVPVRGQATTHLDMSVRLSPHASAWVIGLEARGRVDTRTYASEGPALAHTRGSTLFHADKRVLITPLGIQSAASRCEATSRQRLVGVASTYDDMLLVGRFIRSQARGQYEEKSRRARLEAESEVRSRVNRALDQEAEEALAKMTERYQSEFLSRADSLGVEVKPLELRTTDSRLIARLRLASPGQLGSHTPRNRAPSNSLASLQIHESAINNVLEGLHFAGRKMTADQVRSELAEKFRFSYPIRSDPSTEQAILRFAQEDPIRVSLSGGRAELVLAFEELLLGRARFRAFKVHSYYQLGASDAGAWLIQEGPVQIEGRLRAANRARLHGAFGKIMPSERTLSLFRPTPQQREKISGLQVTQLVISDGWLGIALGPDSPRHVAVVGKYVR